MSGSLPLYINPWLLYRHNETVNGTLSLDKMPYLQASENRQSGLVQVTLAVFQRDDQCIMLSGESSVELALTCQRCLKPIVERFIVPIELVLVKSERQLALVSDEDDAIFCEDTLDLIPLVEQELILALPMIAKHKDCEAMYEKVSKEDVVEYQQPFANIKDLLN
ncbi:MAG: YceD family protein [Ostreibacterium sp.]